MSILRFILLALCIGTSISTLSGRNDASRTERKQLDFLAFYCAGSAVAGGHDPYLAEPLRSCEIAAMRAARVPHTEHVVTPAPLPGYSLAVFALFARLPFAQAALLFTFGLIAALVATLFALRDLTAWPLPFILGALVFCDGWVSVGYGQIVPIALLFLCLAAQLLASNRPRCAACFTAVAMIEPHIALPACIALFIFEHRGRAALVVCAALLCGVSMLTLGLATNLEYLAQVLPAHALAESNQIQQFGLTTLLHRLGVNSSLALRLAELSYIAMVGIGLYAAQRLAARTERPELLILLPPAFALLGGPYVHISQMVFAIPALLVLMRSFAGQRTLLTAALLLVTIPWLELAGSNPAAVLVAVAAVATTILSSVMRARLAQMLITLLLMLTIALGELLIRVAFPAIRLNPQPELDRAAGGSLLADATWAIWVRSEVSNPQWYITSHAPTWIGLMIMVVAAISLSRHSASPIALALPSTRSELINSKFARAPFK